MKKITSLLTGSSIFLLPVVALAQFNSDGGELGELFENILLFINGTLIPFIIAIGFLVFVWGMFWFFIAGGANDEKKEKGRSLMIWATVGFLLIIVFWGIINLLVDFSGVGDEPLDERFVPRVNELNR